MAECEPWGRGKENQATWMGDKVRDSPITERGGEARRGLGARRGVISVIGGKKIVPRDDITMVWGG